MTERSAAMAADAVITPRTVLPCPVFDLWGALTGSRMCGYAVAAGFPNSQLVRIVTTLRPCPG